MLMAFLSRGERGTVIQLGADLERMIEHRGQRAHVTAHCVQRMMLTPRQGTS
jgi:hypothetical protein